MTQINREVLEATLGRQLHWISAADSKIPPVLAISTAMLGVVSGFAPQPGDWTFLMALSASVTIVLLGKAVIELFLAGFPRTMGPKGSLVFFGGITERAEAEFVGAVLALDEDTYLRDLASQCYRNAEIAGKKFTYVKAATKSLFFAFAPWALTVYLMYGYSR